MFDERRELVAAYRATPVVLPFLLGNGRGSHPAARQASVEWSAAAVVAHLADTEERALARVVRILHEDRPELPAYDPDELAVESNYEAIDVLEALRRFQRSRAAHIAQLEALDHEEWARTGLHQEVGEISIQQLTAHMVSHDLTHMAQIARAIGAKPESQPAR